MLGGGPGCRAGEGALGLGAARSSFGVLWRRLWAGWRMTRSAPCFLRLCLSTPLPEIEALLHHVGVWTGELRHRTRAGDEIVVAARKVLRRDSDGEPFQVMESVADVTPLR